MIENSEMSKGDASPALDHNFGNLFPTGIFQTQAVMAFASAIAKDPNVALTTRQKAEEALRGDKNFLERQIQLLTSALDEINQKDRFAEDSSEAGAARLEKRLDKLQKTLPDFKNKFMKMEKNIQSMNSQFVTKHDLAMTSISLKWFIVSSLAIAFLTMGATLGYVRTLTH